MEQETPSYYAILTADVRYDPDLKANSKLLYAEITALCNAKGYCWASNGYFAKLYQVTPQAVSKWVSQLEQKGYIKTKFIYQGKCVKARHIFLKGVSTNIDRVSTNDLGGYQQMIKVNTKSFNTKYNNSNLTHLQDFKNLHTQTDWADDLT